MNQKKLASLIYNMLVDGFEQHSRLMEETFLRRSLLYAFCSERSNNIAQAMPELIEECEKNES